MFFARFDGPSGELVQAAVALSPVPALDEQAAELWWRTLEDLVGSLAGLNYESLVMRLVAAPDGAARRSFFITVPRSEEAALRHWVAAATRLERLDGTPLAIAQSREMHDALLAAFPSYRCAVPHGVGELPGGAWLAGSFRAASWLAELFRDAAIFGHTVGYSLQLSPITADRTELLRALRKNAVALDYAAEIPPAIKAEQRHILADCEETSDEREEILACDNEASAAWLAKAAAGQIENSARRYGIGMPLPPVAHGGLVDSIETGLAQAVLFERTVRSPAELAAVAESRSRAASVLAWRPPLALAASWRPKGGPDEPPRGPDFEWPVPPHEGPGPFAFISYAHTDTARIGALLHPLAAARLPAWYDKGIPGGVEWDSHIEERIKTCTLLVAFVSPATVASKYCRREIKFADAIDKPMLSIVLQATPLGHGLEMLLPSFQMIDAAATDFGDRFLRSLALLAATPGS